MYRQASKTNSEPRFLPSHKLLRWNVIEKEGNASSAITSHEPRSALVRPFLHRPVRDNFLHNGIILTIIQARFESWNIYLTIYRHCDCQDSEGYGEKDGSLPCWRLVYHQGQDETGDARKSEPSILLNIAFVRHDEQHYTQRDTGCDHKVTRVGM